VHNETLSIVAMCVCNEDCSPGADWIWPLELDVYLDAAQAHLKVPKHFMSAICGLIDATSKLCRVDERVAKGTFPTISLEPVDSLLDQLATFRACNFQR
jgi:hypothetical protein